MGIYEALVFLGTGESEKLKTVQAKFKELENLFVEMSKVDFSEVNTILELYKKIEWPPCLDLSKEKQKEILDIVNINSNQGISEKIFEGYDEKTLNKVLARWQKCSYLERDRLLILKEAIENYLCGRYYSCVALNTTQYAGIINNTKKVMEQYPKLQEKICKIKIQQKELLKRGKGDIEKGEKFVLEQQQYAIFNYTTLMYNDYFKKYIFSSKLFDKHPNRNKICHGEDINFGNKENALKSILCIDGLIRLYLFMDKLNIEN